ncbi:Fur family transcriptional regulator [Atribacter laminatus]|jgi:Fur family ferric uptake transcriptional regulator|uniref:Ferric uptake regulation protein n=1 Tax=Atribacter laminatus TaxID=2847778 RepID=A0A7T1AKG0_ATRLM|nr:Fur family transcriptional regulator [Atribacter laminatus]QPM67559.1 Ferric uptake regulation protein [Atribacter laminatus]
MSNHEWEKVLKKHNIKVTSSRMAIVELFEENRKHLSAEEVHEFLKKRNQKAGIATVYRNLDLLTKVGILHRVNFGDGKDHFEITQRPIHHHHLVCNKCGRVVDYSEIMGESEFVSYLEKELTQRYGFKIESHQIYFYGLCDKCR